MITSRETFERHSASWGDGDAYERLPDLLPLIKEQIDGGDNDPAHIINYGAILLDLHRNREALDWFRKNRVDYKEYYENLATAYAKTDPKNASPIRANNIKARESPGCPNAILAYIDYQGM